MNNEELRELVKKHFNLTEPTAEVKEEMSEEVASEQIFGEISTADGELTLTYEGEELSIGLPIFVKTEDGNVPAPDGEHALEGGVIIKTEGGSIVEIAEESTEVIAEEEEVVATEEEKMSEETTETEENFEEHEDEMEEKEDIIEAIAEVVIPMIEEMKQEIEEMKSKFSETESKVQEFALAPAAERTKAEIRNRNHSKVDTSYNPINDDKKKQFERLLKIRNKK